MSKELETLGLEPTATTAEIKTRWRTLASQLHPDRGGNADDFHKMRQAYIKALAASEKPKKCERCKGSGRARVTKGFHSVMVTCPDCAQGFISP